jgi:ribose/xylose/arabinose/galactoside ABC-type transport system permease subunit
VDQGRPTLGATLLLDIIAAVVIGGTSLFGGRGKIIWTVFGVVFLVLLGNALSLLNVPFFCVGIVKGSVILLAALLDVVRRRVALQQA